MKTIKTLFGILTITAALAVHVQAQPASAFVWTLLATNVPSDWNSSPASIDMCHGIIYSLSSSGDFWEYSIQSNTFTQLPVSGWPGGASGAQPYANEFIYNPDENAIWLTLNGRGQVFRLPVTGGAVTSVGASGEPETDFGNLNYWNPVTHAMGAVFGYGYDAVRNWRWEFGTNDSDWVQIQADTPGQQPWERDVNNSECAMDFNGQRVFVYGFTGNSTGVQGQFDAGFSNNGDQFDYLKDLWVLNLQSNAWSNLIPLNSSIPICDSSIVYYPPLNTLFMLNGYQIPTNASPSVTAAGLWTFVVGQSTNWTQVGETGDVPSAADDAAYKATGNAANSYYDPIHQRILHFNFSGVYALNIGPQIGLIKAVEPSFSYLAVGTNYQLQVSGDLNTWTNQGSPFTATNTSMVYPQYFNVDNWNQLFFRLQEVP